VIATPPAKHKANGGAGGKNAAIKNRRWYHNIHLREKDFYTTFGFDSCLTN
jgi:hypothetical protein